MHSQPQGSLSSYQRMQGSGREGNGTTKGQGAPAAEVNENIGWGETGYQIEDEGLHLTH